MTINQMQYFSTVCTYRNITTASKVLSISQPALSSSLSDLELEVGCKLLDRTSKGVTPTAEGLRLLNHIDSVLSRYRLLKKELPLIVQGQSTLRVGFRPYSGESQMIRLCSAFKQTHSAVNIVFNEMRNRTPFLFLEEDQIDFLATTPRLMPDDWHEKYNFCTLGEPDEVKLYCHILNPLAKLEEVGAKELHDCPIAFWDGHTEVLERLKEMMDCKGYRLNHVATMPQVSGVANLICNDAAVGVLGGDFAEHIDIIHGCRLKAELAPVFLNGSSVQNYLVWKKSIERYDIMRQFIVFARKWS